MSSLTTLLVPGTNKVIPSPSESSVVPQYAQSNPPGRFTVMKSEAKMKNAQELKDWEIMVAAAKPGTLPYLTARCRLLECKLKDVESCYQELRNQNDQNGSSSPKTQELKEKTLLLANLENTHGKLMEEHAALQSQAKKAKAQYELTLAGKTKELEGKQREFDEFKAAAKRKESEVTAAFQKSQDESRQAKAEKAAKEKIENDLRTQIRALETAKQSLEVKLKEAKDALDNEASDEAKMKKLENDLKQKNLEIRDFERNKAELTSKLSVLQRQLESMVSEQLELERGYKEKENEWIETIDELKSEMAQKEEESATLKRKCASLEGKDVEVSELKRKLADAEKAIVEGDSKRARMETAHQQESAKFAKAQKRMHEMEQFLSSLQVQMASFSADGETENPNPIKVEQFL